MLSANRLKAPTSSWKLCFHSGPHGVRHFVRWIEQRQRIKQVRHANVHGFWEWRRGWAKFQSDSLFPLIVGLLIEPHYGTLD